MAGSGRLQVRRQPSLFVKYLGYDMLREVTPYVPGLPNPFRDRRVRQALHAALDRRALVAGLSTDAVPAWQMVPRAIFGYNPQIAEPLPDRDRARDLLRQAGLPTGFAATLHVRKVYAEAARLVRDQLREVGVRLEVVALGDTEALPRFHRGDTSLLLSRFGCPTGDASDILDNGIHTPDPARRLGIQNYGGYSNPEVDRAIQESAGIDSIPHRRKALEAIMAAIMDDLAWIPLYVDQDVYGLDRRLIWKPRADGFILAAEISRQ